MYRLAPNPWISTGWGRGQAAPTWQEGFPGSMYISFRAVVGLGPRSAAVLSDDIARTRAGETREVTLAGPPLRLAATFREEGHQEEPACEKMAAGKALGSPRLGSPGFWSAG